MCHSTLAIYCFIDDFLKASNHLEDIRAEVSDAEIITIALTAMLHFGGNAREIVPCFARIGTCQTASFAFAVFASGESLGGFDLSAVPSIGQRS